MTDLQLLVKGGSTPSLLRLFTQEAHHGPYYASQHSVMLVAAPDMVTAQALVAGLHDGDGRAYLIWGACKIIKGARISGDSRIVSILG